MERYLVTAGGRIQCLRCTAHNRLGEQCSRPAIKSSKTRKCQFHGGASTGPRTEAGRDRIREANWKHGERSAQGITRAAKAAARLRQAEDALRVLGAIGGAKQVGRQPSLYKPLETMDEVREFALALIENGGIL